MKFQSTRDANKTKYSSAEVIKQGLADDGGLFVPEEIPSITFDDIERYRKLSYPELAAEILSKFLTDYSWGELLEDCRNAYSEKSFPDGVCPVKKVNNYTFSLELWHGPTCAFKDMALQLMPRLLSRALKKTHEERTALVLVATSGDTGKAALEGCKNVDGIKTAVFYPESGVSSVQKLQMITQDGSNVNVCGVKGNFDDIQTGVKKIFSDETIAKMLDERGYFLSSANSINFGRLAPQIVYYIKAYCDLLNCAEIELGEKINVCVPTGNFGNILAAYIAKLMGLPIDKLICASNSNSILTDFLRTGIYDRNREFHLTMSPSMDILISSNLERLLYFFCGAEKTSQYMRSLNEMGAYTIDGSERQAISESFVGFSADEKKTAEAIRINYEKYGYLIDTHTAVGFSALADYRAISGDNRKTVVASTANPYKFAKDVYISLFGKAPESDLASLDNLKNATGTEIPKPLCDLDKRAVNFPAVTSKEGMLGEVIKFTER